MLACCRCYCERIEFTLQPAAASQAAGSRRPGEGEPLILALTLMRFAEGASYSNINVKPRIRMSAGAEEHGAFASLTLGRMEDGLPLYKPEVFVPSVPFRFNQSSRRTTQPDRGAAGRQ